MFVQPVSSFVHLHPVQRDTTLDVVRDRDEVVVELGQPLFIVPLVELVEFLQR